MSWAYANRRALEEYVGGRVVHVHFAIWPNGFGYGNAEQVCARFSYAGGSAEWFLADCSRDLHPLIYHKDGAVLVDVVQFVQDEQGIDARVGLASLVWLRVLNGCEFFRIKNGLKVLDFPVVRELLPIFVDREVKNAIQIPNVFLGSLDVTVKPIRMLLRQLEREMVEARSRVVDDFTYPHTPLRRWLYNVCHGTDVVPFKLRLSDDGIDGIANGRRFLELGFEVVEVFFGAVEFGEHSAGYLDTTAHESG